MSEQADAAPADSISVESVFRDNAKLTDQLMDGETNKAELRKLLVYAAAGCAAYGLVIGIWRSPIQGISAAIKLPILFAISLVITLPAFHFIGLHAGSRLKFTQTLSIIRSGMAVTGILLAAFAPIALFFLISDSSQSFLILLHFAIIGFCSLAGIMTIHRSIRHISKSRGEQFTEGAESCLIAWFFLFAFVGMQLAWLMRPWLGSHEDFTILRGGGGNFYTAILRSLDGVIF